MEENKKIEVSSKNSSFKAPWKIILQLGSLSVFLIASIMLAIQILSYVDRYFYFYGRTLETSAITLIEALMGSFLLFCSSPRGVGFLKGEKNLAIFSIALAVLSIIFWGFMPFYYYIHPTNIFYRYFLNILYLFEVVLPLPLGYAMILTGSFFMTEKRN